MLLNFQQYGSENNPSLILIHGLFGSLENLNSLAKPLSEHFHVTNVDLRNHGRSFHSESISYPEMAQDVHQLLAHLNIEKAHVVGHSMGGKVAMQLAHDYPEHLKKLVVLDIAPVKYHARHTQIIAGLESVARINVTDRRHADQILSSYIDTVGVRQFLLKSLAKNDVGEFVWRFNLSSIATNYDAITDNVFTSEKVMCETLFIKGNNSDYILEEHRKSIVSLFPNTKAKIIHGAGHWLHAEKPEAVNRSIIDFLQ